MKLQIITKMILSSRILRHSFIFPLLAGLLPLPALSYNSLRGTISNSGVYSVDYATLRAAGFSNPENVGARGLDGTIPVLHRDGRLIMWLRGVDNFAYHATNSGMGYFENKRRDIYCNERSFILTDNPQFFLPIEESTLVPGGDPVEQGVIFSAYEKDLFHNITGTGNIFWGENLNITGGASYSWTVNIPGIAPSTDARFDAQLYSTASEGTFRVGTGSGRLKDFPVNHTAVISLRPSAISSEITLNPGSNTIVMEYDNHGNYADAVNLDYWTISAPCQLTPSFSASLPATTTETEFSSTSYSGLIGLHALRNLQEAHIVTGSDDVVAFDLSSSVVLLRPSHDGKIALKGNGRPHTLSLCNLSLPLQSPSLAAACEEETLLEESLLSTPADMLIVSPRWLAAKSRELADIHREHDGMSVTTAILDETYNHFSAGNPSIDAVRNLVKRIKEASGGRLKNLLLVGPMSGDIRSFSSDSIFIAPQTSNTHPSRGAYCTLDRYVIDEDTEKDDLLMKSELDMGVASLPFESEDEADRYIGKLKEYLDSPFTLASLEGILWMGGEGDHHTHEFQTRDLALKVSDYSGEKTLHSMLPIDAYGFPQARKKMLDYLDDGKAFSVYIGHASENSFGKENNTFFSTANLLSLHNLPLTFLITAGCSATETDRRMRGLAEHMILTSSNGAIGGLVTTRETWSSQNFNFLSNFFESLYDNFIPTGDNDENSHPVPPTIGELYAHSKSLNIDVNKLAYTLMCDPAIRIPAASYGVGWNLAEPLAINKDVKIDGEIISNERRCVDNFNGRIMLRLLAPPMSLISHNLTSGAVDSIGKEMTVKYDDRVIAVKETEVINGRFSFSFPLPEAAHRYAADGIRLYFTALEENGLTGAASYSADLSIDTEQIMPSEFKRMASISALGYNPHTGRLTIDVDYNARRNFAIESEPEIMIDGNLYRYSSGLMRLTGDNDEGLTFLTTLPSLGKGNHTVEVSLRDAAGNLLNICETISADTANSLMLTADNVAVRNEVKFKHDASADGTTLIVIENGNGLPVCRLAPQGETLSWDRKDNAGQELPAGIYRCYLRHTAPDGRLSFSTPITLTLL